MKPYRKDLKLLARHLRSNMTDAEQLLWQRLRNKQLHGMQFYRQKPLLDYVVDFYCPRALLVVELDGSQHYEQDHAANDAIRDARLAALGLRILRFNNHQTLAALDSVLTMIESALVDSTR